MVYDNHVRHLPENHHMCRHGSREGDPKRVPHMRPRDWLRVWVKSDVRPAQGMKRLSIFYLLPYVKHLLIAHLLDHMHILIIIKKSMYLFGDI